ncbi:uncharacterized protein KY384_006799 [Bacidia gigantensis]|uniref:uncharacterized protein n=1 Tax=Bacidia gigantensis TaxID=2732470 RepID=UPI001D040ECB|nr:uncharacterized protein KY384_006799 [Bacidia gigantensis]KAG8527883.1 hypothetical protein KY384_006799 [Bacidia gigantensis]
MNTMETTLPLTDTTDWHGILTAADPLPVLPTYQDTILDIPPISTRAGLYVYLSSMLSPPPTFSNARIIQYLQTRYHPPIDDVQSEIVQQQATDLILTSFLVLANSLSTSVPDRTRILVRNFIVNKLPVFLHGQYFNLLPPPLTIETCIRQALAQLPSDSLSAQTRASFSLDDARQEFIYSAALHNLIPEASIQDILNDVSFLDLPTTRYTSENIVAQIATSSTDLNQLDALVIEMEDFKGNSGAIAEALGDVIRGCCDKGDTMGLRSVCVSLAKRVGSVDVLILFNPETDGQDGKPGILSKLCTLLDNWPVGDAEGGEQHPVYDEFGAVLLFINAVRARYLLSSLTSDPVILQNSNDEDSFLSKYFKTSSVSKSPDSLSPHESEILSSWLKSLYETEGISDELMSACAPSEFHLLIATLLDQSIKAVHARIITLDTLKGGFEYLLEPFLLPSLIVGFKWFADTMWAMQEGNPMIDVTMQALIALLKPARLSKESESIHATVVRIVAKRLESSLIYLTRQFPPRGDIRSLLSILSPYTNDNVLKFLSRDLNSWTAYPRDALRGSLKFMIQNLILWTNDSANNLTPTPFHFHKLQTCIQVLGAYKTLDALIDEVQNADPNLQEVALDVVATLILAERHKTSSSGQANSGTNRIPMNLGNLLVMRYDGAEELAKTDDARASTIVRLYKRVQTYDGQQVAMQIAPQGVALGTNGNAGGMERHEIDDVLAEAEVQNAAAQGFLSGEVQAGDLMGMV